MTPDFQQPDITALDRAAFLVGTPIAHSSSPTLHHAIYSSKGRNYAQVLCETHDLSGFINYIRHEPKCMGSGVTMPFKVAVIPFLDDLTAEGKTIGAVNTIFFEPDSTKVGGRKFIGTNTDCIGIRDAFVSNVSSELYQSFRNRPGLIIGGGGTCRAAVYSLTRFFGCSKVYIINRDKAEVDMVLEECSKQGMGAGDLIHVESLAQADTLVPPTVIVSAVPDFPPVTEGEKRVRQILAHFLSSDTKGAVLEMCYHPSPVTQISTLSVASGWQVIGGIEAMIGQGLAQASLWTGIEIDEVLRATVRTHIQENLRRKSTR